MDFDTCPKCGYRRQTQGVEPYLECPRCGIVFAKYSKYHSEQPPADTSATVAVVESDEADEVWYRRPVDCFWELPEKPDEMVLGFQALLLGALVIWGIRLISYRWQFADINASFLHLVNLPIHEFGHVLFRPFGEWMMYLGGSLFQCLLPAILGGVFLWRQHEPYAASFCLWWTGENFLDVAPYIGDARLMALPLTGEWNDDVAELHALRHDWHNILAPLGLLSADFRLAAWVHGIGAALMILACLWAGRWLWLSWNKLKADSGA